MGLLRVWIGVLLATGALALSACGAEDVPSEDIAQAAQTTMDAGSSRMQIETTVPLADGQTFEMVGEGIADMAAQRGQMTFDLSALPGGEGEMEILFDEFVMYMRMPQLQRELPFGVEWIKADLQEVGESAGIDFAQFSQMGNDPTKQLDYLRAAGDIEREGEEEVRGVPTTHYSGTTDLREYPELVPEAEREAAQKSVDALLELGTPAETPFEVWLDEDDLVRRMRMKIAMPQAGGLEPAQTEMEYEFYDFGVEVDVDFPSGNDVMDVTDQASGELERRQAP